MKRLLLGLCLALATTTTQAATPPTIEVAPRDRLQVYRQPSGATIIIRRENDIILRNPDGTRTVIPAAPSTPFLPPRGQR